VICVVCCERPFAEVETDDVAVLRAECARKAARKLEKNGRLEDMLEECFEGECWERVREMARTRSRRRLSDSKDVEVRRLQEADGVVRKRK